MKCLIIFNLIINLSSCYKQDINCIVKNAQGEKLYKVVGSDRCEEQISQENGEYCECME